MSVLPWDKQAQSFRLFSLIVYTFYMFYTAEIASNQTGQLFWALPPVFGLFAFKLAVHVRTMEYNGVSPHGKEVLFALRSAPAAAAADARHETSQKFRM